MEIADGALLVIGGRHEIEPAPMPGEANPALDDGLHGGCRRKRLPIGKLRLVPQAKTVVEGLDCVQRLAEHIQVVGEKMLHAVHPVGLAQHLAGMAYVLVHPSSLQVYGGNLAVEGDGRNTQRMMEMLHKIGGHVLPDVTQDPCPVDIVGRQRLVLQENIAVHLLAIRTPRQDIMRRR